MSTRVIEAIVARWDANSLGDTFPGGLWFDVAPPGTAYPFVQLTGLGNTRVGDTSTSEYRSQQYQMSIFYEETTGTDPVSSLGALMRALDDVFDGGPLSIPTSAGHVYDVVRQRDDLRRDPAERIWIGVIDYDVRRRVPVNRSKT